MDTQNSTVNQILSCAQSLIVAGGYNGFSYADIAKVVGIRNASIHHHFPGKADLVRTLIANYRKQGQEGLAALERNVPEPVEQLRAYLGYWEACVGDPSSSFCVCALLASEIPVIPEEVALEVKAHFRTLSGWLTSVFERGTGAGSLRLANSPAVEAELFMATVHGAMLSARAYGDARMFGVIVHPLLERYVGRIS